MDTVSVIPLFKIDDAYADMLKMVYQVKFWLRPVGNN